MMNREIYWALAREHAARVFSEANPEARLPLPGELVPGELILERRGSCAVIAIKGEIYKETLVFEGRIWRLGHDAIRQALDLALASPAVKSVILDIDSPGGTVAGTKELFDFIAEAAKLKPMAAYADGLCASAAFWLASATGRIFAPATALVGSVGVIMQVENWTGFFTKMGVQIEYITSGQYKAAGQQGKELTEEERAYFAGQLAGLHGIFREDVRKALAITAGDALWAEAQLLPALQAEKLGLVSGIVRDLDAAIKLFKGENMDLNQLKADHPQLVEALALEFQEKASQESSQAAENVKREMLALARAVAGDEAAEKMEALAKAGISASQLEAVKPILAKPENGDVKGKILENIEKAANQPITGQAASRKNPLLADAERRARRATC